MRSDCEQTRPPQAFEFLRRQHGLLAAWRVRISDPERAPAQRTGRHKNRRRNTTFSKFWKCVLNHRSKSVVKCYRSVTLSWHQRSLIVGRDRFCNAKEQVHLPGEFPSL